MFKTRVALLGLAAIFIVSGSVASVASAAGPFWRVNGTRLEQGKTAVNISAIQFEPELKGKVLGLGAWVSCKVAQTQNAYIEGNGTNQGLDSASSITFEKCTTHEPANCTVVEPIKTKPLKSALVEYTNSAKQLKIGDLFEPTQGTTFVELEFVGASCSVKGTKFPVTGNIVAEVFPENQEALKGRLIFPNEPIKKVKHEGTEVSVALLLGLVEAKFVATFEASLVSGLKWGAFTT